jgi:hypothetical protein
MYNVNNGRQSQASIVNQNPTVRTRQIVKNEEGYAPSARRRGSRHEREDVWRTDAVE